MIPLITPTTAPSQHLRQLLLIRFLLVIGLGLATMIAFWGKQVTLEPPLHVFLLLAAINGLSMARLYASYPVSPIELLAQLAIDILAVTYLAYYTGGANNPFLSYILVPVCIAATILPATYAWTLSAIAVALYAALLVWHEPLSMLAPPDHRHAQQVPGVNPHIIGMWLNFSLSALLISHFVVKMATTVRLKQNEINDRREEDLRDEQLLALATQAAGTAHELGTPLSTMKVTLSDLRADTQLNDSIGDELAILSSQVEKCSSMLQNLRARTDMGQLAHPPRVNALQYCEQLIERWRLLRPDTPPLLRLSPELRTRSVRLHVTIEQAILNVLNNAAEASNKGISVTVNIEGEKLIWAIADSGEGIKEQTRDRLGKQLFTTKESGMGIGLFLTHASIQRYGGRVSHRAIESGGTATRIELPLEETHA